jgi:hypothetical protein
MKKRHVVSMSLLSWAALATLAFFLWPTEVYAWGPLAHLNFSSGALESLSALTPAMRIILARYSGEFLYGSLAADIIVGKNLARYAVHCHNWTVGFQVLDRAKTDAQKAFSLGFLAHLAVDTIAHNYYVPYKTVQSFKKRAAGHAYWELRYDQKLPADLWKLARRVCQQSFREHDEHLEECLAESYVIPFAISKTMFGSMLLAARLKKWQRMSEVVAGDRDEALHEEEVRECQKLAVGQIVDMLKEGQAARCTQADPTGGRNLHMATQLRTTLKARKDLSDRQSDEIVRASRPAFKAGIYGRLTLPQLPGQTLAA